MITRAAIHAIRRVVGESTASDCSWQALLDKCQEFLPSALWSELPTPELEQDIASANAWISQEALREAENGNAKGLYFGLDTLNMEEPANMNVQLGGSGDCDPNKLDLEWMYECTWYAHEHLIVSLRAMKRVYDDERWPYGTRDFADYGLFLGYSGIVLLAALERITWPTGYLAVWGFHDGDMFPLLRQRNGEFERLAARDAA